MKKIKVLQVNKLYVPYIGGIENVVRDIAEGLNEETDMSVLVCQPKGGASKESYNGVKVTRAHSFGIFFSMPVSLDFFLKYRKMAKEADIIQFHVPFPLADIAHVLFKTKAKTVIWWHSDIVRQKFFLKLLKPFINKSLKKADLIIAATPEHAAGSVFIKKYGEKTKTIPYGLDFNLYSGQPISNFLYNKLGKKENFKLLFAGRLVYYKGIEIAIKAMSYIDNAELFIVGDGKLSDEMKALSKKLALEEKVHFLGELSFDELKAAYNDCDIFVFPSVANSETFGIVQLEAMYYGKPVINTNLPTGVPYVSVDGETGITVPPNDEAALANAVNRLCSDDELRLKLGENARKRVLEHFSLSEMNDGLFDCYVKLCDGKNNY